MLVRTGLYRKGLYRTGLYRTQRTMRVFASAAKLEFQTKSDTAGNVNGVWTQTAGLLLGNPTVALVFEIV